MTTHIYKKRVLFTACMFALMSAGGYATAQSTNTAPSGNTTASTKMSGDEAQDARLHLEKSVKVVHQMESDAKMKQLLQNAKAVFLVPDYGRAALGVGARGGAGVLLVKHGNSWGDPAFYNMGGVSAGAQAGVEAGAIALVLNSQKALDSFKQDNNFSLNAEAGLTVINWSGKAQGSVGKGDVVVWSDTEGAFGDLAVSVTDINFDEHETGAFYGQKTASAQDVINGKLKAPQSPALAQVQSALEGASETATGGSAAGGTSASGSSSTSGSSGTSGMENPSPSSGTSGAETPSSSGTSGTSGSDMSSGSQGSSTSK